MSFKHYKHPLWHRVLILMLCAGEAVVLVHVGWIHRDWGAAYLIVAVWVKETVHSLAATFA